MKLRIPARRHSREAALVFAILAVAVVMALGAPGFFRFENQRDLSMANMPVAIVALGMTLVILTGQIDISVGSQFAVCSVAAGLLAKAGLPTPVAALATCLAGALLGALNGALVAYVRIPSIVVTLATMVALRDGLRWATQGAWVQDLPPGFQWFGQSQAASEGITLAAVLLLISAFAWGLRYLAAGRAFYAAGSNPEAARLAGIEPSRVVFAAFTVTGALTGFAALANAVRFNQIPSNGGIGLELQTIAAVIVGGVAVTGGQGTLAGAMLGVVLLGMIGPALTFLGISAYWERAIQGAIILAAVALDRSKAASHAAGPAAGPTAGSAAPPPLENHAQRA
jgi:rhamnose transport system permease protein